jgi:hypothetical protein
MDHRAVAEQRSHHVQAFAARGLDAVLLATNGPGAAVGVDLRKTGLIEVGQVDLTRLRLRPERIYLLPAALESEVISFF